MNAEFSKFEKLRNEGRTAAAAYQVAKADQLGDLFALRMLRAVYGLSLPDAKRISGVMEKLSAPQNPVIGQRVYWEGSDTIDGTWIIEATVSRIEDGFVYVEQHRKFLLKPEGLVETSADGALSRIPQRYFSKSLIDRLNEVADFWKELMQV